ncbi:MAG TPA: SDR family NAD(P)-dependent oxidoreductase [Acidimicrobiales bacterium]|nr:SDR family NAD(P)-dependent oxidoreductase [Acidimicrobiales bacterium]
MRFDGRVVIVTGAGRGIGRAYAELFRALGAEVVANDIDEVEGVTHVGDVSDPAYAQQLVDTHDRVDALVNNAGNVQWATMPDVDAANLDAHLRVHVHGTFNTISAAWPRMVAAAYGRIVNTTSTGALGLKGNLGYATAKGAVIGMTRTLAVEGAPHGIKVNAVAPVAATRLGGDVDDPNMAPARVAPMAAYLASEDCPVSGQIYTAGAGRFARLFVGSTPGVVADDVESNWQQINDATGYTIPADLMEWSAEYLRHLHSPNQP